MEQTSTVHQAERQGNEARATELQLKRQGQDQRSGRSTHDLPQALTPAHASDRMTGLCTLAMATTTSSVKLLVSLVLALWRTKLTPKQALELRR